MANAHLQAIALCEDVEVTVLVDKVLPRARQLAGRFNVPTAVDDYRQIFDDVDAAIAALPHHLHAEVSIELLQRGIHVLVEKPMALSTSDCDAMIQAAAGSGTVLTVGLARRFFLSSQFLKQAITSGLLGDIISFDFREGTSYKWPVSSDFAFRKETGGGVLADTGVHVLDLLLWWLGDYNSIEYYYDDAMGGVEADCELRLKMQNGATGVVDLSRTRELRNTCIIRGELGSLEVETKFNSKIRLKMQGQDLTLTGRVIRNGLSEEKANDIFRRQIDDFVDAIRLHREPFIPDREGKRSVELIESCYALRQPLQHPWIC
ncbi:Gfo/Idh/MocA family oxidoreductase [candidate division KSB1 bacterium]|nr:Gfo/Idh/MocA family oxidoreductase [candidate division KSB1 bacterium]